MCRLTAVSAFDKSLVKMTLVGVLQDVEEAPVDSIGKVGDGPQKHFGCFGGNLAQCGYLLEVLDRQCVALVHVRRCHLRVESS